MVEDVKISALAEKDHLDPTDYLVVVDNEVDPPITKRVPVEDAHEEFQGIEGPQGETGPAGSDGAVYEWNGPWVTATAYEINDCIEYDGEGYVCTTNHTSGTFATDLAAEKWNLFVEKGEGTSYPFQGPWLTSTAYFVNDCVEHDGSGYVCMTSHGSGTFSTDLAANKWKLLVEKGEKGDDGEQGITGSDVNLAFGTSDTPPGGADDGTLYVVYIP